MNPINDAELLRRYARERSEAALAALVEPHRMTPSRTWFR
jgi:hypothetical protein